jgi:hypothetical protein
MPWKFLKTFPAVFYQHLPWQAGGSGNLGCALLGSHGSVLHLEVGMVRLNYSTTDILLDIAET